MPAIDQCDPVQGNMTALSSTIEVFDKFKSDNCNDSDSDESFHLQLDEDDAESQSVISNGKDKELHNDETEEEILNKFDAVPSQTIENCDAKSDDLILNDPEDASSQHNGKSPQRNGTDTDSEEQQEDSSAIEVKLTFDFGEYENTAANGEFRSFYESNEKPIKDLNSDSLEENTFNNSSNSNDLTIVTDHSDDAMEVDDAKNTVDAIIEKLESQENDTEPKQSEPETKPSKLDESTDDLIKQLEETINPSNSKSEPNEAQTVKEEPKNLSGEMKKDNEKEKSEEDETDLLDISMIRETEEDDACARADAIDDDEPDDTEKGPPSEDKSDEDPNEKLEQEGDSNDGEKDDDADNNFETFEDLDADIPMEIQENDNDIGGLECQDNSNSTTLEDVQSKVNSNESQGGEEIDSLDKVDKQIDDEALKNKDEESEATDDGCILTDSVVFNETDNDLSNASTVIPLPDVSLEAEEPKKTSSGKRSLLASGDEEEINAKKPKISDSLTDAEENKDAATETVEGDSTDQLSTPKDKVKSLPAFAKFMQCRKLTSKLSRSDLEQFCLQKICESLMLRSSEGELHQTIKKQEITIEGLKKDVQQLIKQAKDLEIVNKKLMTELRSQTTQKKLIVPLKITRSVGLQVRLHPGNETSAQGRRRQTPVPSPQKPVPIVASPLNRNKSGPQQSAVVRQVNQTTTSKAIMTIAPNNSSVNLLSSSLQTNNKRSPVVVKRTNSVTRKPPESSNASTPGVIDLTDEDEKLIANKAGNSMNLVNKTVANKLPLSKVVDKNGINQGKSAGLQSKTAAGPSKSNTVPQSIRITTPTSVITSGANGSQMLYVVPTIASSSGGTQKVAFVNFQPSNGVLSGTLNGSTMSVVPSKPGQTLTLKTVPTLTRYKHPATLPPTPRILNNSSLKPLLPKPYLTIKKIDIGIILQWKMPYNLELYESIASYQLYAYQETSAPPSTDMWRKVGDVKALALPMACTLTQFADKNKYYFAVRSVDVHRRIGAFSEPQEISL